MGMKVSLCKDSSDGGFVQNLSRKEKVEMKMKDRFRR